MIAIASQWVVLPQAAAEPELRCWWARPDASQAVRGAVLVLPEVFGLNGWVCSLVDRLAAQGYAALALPIFARTAPGFACGYDEAGLAQGRQHRDRVTAAGVLADARRAIAWLRQQQDLAECPVSCIGFCFGGHLSLVVATLAEVALTCDFYGARVSCFRPGGGEPTLALMPQIAGDVLCICGQEDPLMPAEELEAIARALQDSGSPRRRELVVLPGAGHGFMCDQRDDFRPDAAASGWELMLEALAEARLGP